MANDPFEGLDNMWDGIHKHHQRQNDEFRKLCTEPTAKVPVVGDRVLVAAGLLGMGHEWVRLEAMIVECGDTSYKVQFSDKRESPTPKWVHQALITDVLGKQTT